MNKFKIVFTVLMALFISVVFASCGTSYKDLKISFDSESENVRIVLDSDYWEAKGLSENISSTSTSIKIKFSNIKSKKVGDVDVQVIPADLAQISSYELVNKVATFNVTALRSGNGSIVVTHLGSNKNLEIPLTIEKKAVESESLGKTIVLNIPNEGENTYSIETEKLITFLPEKDCTDVVSWRLVDESLNETSFAKDSGIEFNEDNTKIIINSESEGGKFYLSPVLKMESYEDALQNFKIELKILKLLDVDNISFNVENGVYDEKNDVIKLFVNNSDYNYASVNLNIDGENILNNDTLKEIYDFDLRNVVSSSTDGIEVIEQAGSYRIMAPTATKQDEWVEFSFKPKDVVGDVKTFTKRIKVDLTKVAENIKIKMDGQQLETSSHEGQDYVNVVLLDFYTKYRSGEKFNFDVGDVYADTSVKKMRVKISAKFLSSGNITGDNQFLLQFTKYSNPMVFTSEGEYYYSEPFGSNDSIYIQYVSNETGTETDELKFEIENYYDGSYGEDALKNTEKSLLINVQRSKGIKNIKFNGFYMVNSAESKLNEEANYYVMNSDINTASEIIEAGNLKTDMHVYGINILDMIGADDKSISDVERFILSYKITKDGVEGDYFELYSHIKGNNLLKLQEHKLDVSWNKKGDITNAICLLRNPNTPLMDGEYVLSLTQEESGTTASFKFYIVTSLDAGNVNVGLNYNSYNCYDGSDYADYFGGASSIDCVIVPTNAKLFTSLTLGRTIERSFVEDAGLLQGILDVTAKTVIVDAEGTNTSDKADDYSSFKTDMTKSTSVNSLTGQKTNIYLNGEIRTTNIGTMISGEICYVKITFTVKYIKFDKDENFYKMSAEPTVIEKDTYLFVYVPVTGAYISVDGEKFVKQTIAYPEQDLGYYDKDKAKKTFELGLQTNAQGVDPFEYLTSCSWNTPEGGNTEGGGGNEKTSVYKFVRNDNGDINSCLIKVEIKQFGFSMSLSCQVNLKTPDVTKQIVLRNSTKSINNEKYIYSAVGKTLKFNVSKIGQSTFGEIAYIICDLYGTLYDGYTVDDDGNLLNSSSTKTIDKAIDLRMFIVSSDWLTKDVTNTDFRFVDINDYLNASGQNKAIELCLKFRDGTQKNPLLITSASELEEAKGSSYYFELASDVNMSNKPLNLEEFKGNLSSYKYYELLTSEPKDWSTTYNQYYTYSARDGYVKNEDNAFSFGKYFKLTQSRFTIYNLSFDYSLSKNSYSFIDTLNESAEISYIDFVVNLSGTIESVKEGGVHLKYIGLIGVNNGTVLNVSVETNGEIEINSNATVYLGGIAGENNGTISLTDETLIVSSGKLTVKKSDGKIYVGGVSGGNYNTISGVLLSNTNQDVVYSSVLYGDQGAMFSGEFTLETNYSETETGYIPKDDDTTSGIGGVVGYNLNGKVENVYASGTISGKLNVGGVIGVNWIDTTKGGFTSNNTQNIQSVVKVMGVRRVGGISGLDYSGQYLHVFYEVYESGEIKEALISGGDYVGGLIGYSYAGKLDYSYFNSFRWKYDDETTTTFNNSEFSEGVSDLKGNNYVGGLVGYVKNELKSSSITNSIFNGYLIGKNDVAGLVGYSAGAFSEAKTLVCQGAIYYEDENEFALIRVHYDGSYENNTGTNSCYKVYYYKTENIETENITTNNATLNIEYEGKSLISETPTSIDFSGAIRNDIDAELGTSKDTVSEKVIVLYYYDLIGSGNNYRHDKQEINTINLDDIITRANIRREPAGVPARLKVASNNAIVKVLQDGKILLLGEGEVKLTFTSYYNSKVKDVVTLVIIKKTTKFDIYKNSAMSDEINGDTISLVKDNSKFIYDDYNVGATVTISNTEYRYNSSDNIGIKYEIDKDAVSINNGTITGYIESKEAIILKAEKYDSDLVEIKLVPHIMFSYGGEKYYIEFDSVKTFYIKTKEGVKAVNADVLDANLAKADEMYLTLTVDTDEAIDKIKYAVETKDEEGKTVACKNDAGGEITGDKILMFNNEFKSHEIEFLLGNYNADTQKHTQKFNITINPELKIEKDIFVSIKFYYNDKSCTINLTLIPQKISSLHITNMKNNGGTEGWQRSNLIRPDSGNMLILEVAPSSAYFDYMEITDLTGSEILKFMQYDRFDSSSGLGEALRLNEVVSSDGYGIRLTRENNSNIVYVYAILAVDAEINQTHRIKATAYSSSGKELGTSILLIDAIVYPSVTLTYYDAYGNVAGTNDSRTDARATQINLAFGVEAKMQVETKNNDGEVSWNIDTTYNGTAPTREEFLNALKITARGDYYYLIFDLVELGGKYTIDDDFIAKLLTSSITITAGVQKNTNGHIEKSYAKFEFNLRRLTINGISLKSSKTTSNNRVAGVIGQEETLEFYFNQTDISYYDNGSYWKKIYTKNSEDTTIKSILKQINQLNDAVTFKFSDGTKDIDLGDLLSCPDGFVDNGNKFSYVVNGISYFDISKRDNIDDPIKIVVNKNQINNYYFKIDLNYYYDDRVLTLGESASNQVTISSEVGINFTEYTSPYKYQKIESVDDFMNMVSEQYYILTTDLTLSDYTPLDIELGGFDGNGYTIFLKSFDYYNMANSNSDGIGNFALFYKIYENELIQNLTLDFKTLGANLSEYALSSGGYFQEINFSAIAVENLGMITNCLVKGKVDLSAGQVSPANFKTAGIVNANADTGYITNTTSELIINTTGSVAGFVNENLGKIVTSLFKGEITTSYLSSSTYLSNIETAGFVLNNTGDISLSYVNTKSIVSGGSIGGFVYSNSGDIYDCYIKIVNCQSYGQIGGFVYKSSGNISRCYIDSQITTGRDKKEFVFSNVSGTYENCYFLTAREILSEVSGVKSITRTNALNKDYYDGYIFATSDYGVWSMGENGPQLLNTKTLIETKMNIENVLIGSEANPYLIYDMDSFENLMQYDIGGVLYGSYRVIRDVNFELETPTSCNLIFAGQLDGNNMKLYDFCLFSEQGKESIGLFAGIKQPDFKNGYIRNLVLAPSNIRASTASTVGVLAGYILDGNIYNIDIDGDGIVVLGVNAVGGLAGIVKGSFEINGIKSNVNVKANYGQLYNSNNLYLSKYSTGIEGDGNIKSVSYAGGLIGIVEGYDLRIFSTRKQEDYYTISNCSVSGDISVIGGTVGGMFGLVAEQSMIRDVKYDVGENSYLKGNFVAGGLIGENRGIVYNVALKMASNKYDLFDYGESASYANVNGGIVGVNYGGLVIDCYTNANVMNSYDLATTGGIVGRNSFGVIVNPTFEGAVYGMFAGVVAGTDYDYDTLSKATSVQGSVGATSSALATNIPNYSLISLGGHSINRDDCYQDISLNMINNWYEIQANTLRLLNRNINYFYNYLANVDPSKVEFNYSRVLGVVGLTDKKFYKIKYYTQTNMVNINLDNLGTANELYCDGTLVSGASVDKFKSEELETLYDANTGDPILDPVFGDEKKASELQKHLATDINTNYKFYYFVSVTKATFDFWNSNKGYANGYVYVLN